jgi:hypothetical protein
MIEIELLGAVRQHDGTWTKKVVLDETTAVEENILADQRKIRGKLAVSEPARMTKLLSRCTVSVGTDVRPNGLTRESKSFMETYFDSVWEEAALQDRATGMIAIRQYSVGDEFTFDEDCPNKENCERGKIEGVTVNLGDLKLKATTIDAVRQLHEGIVDVLPRSGKTVRWRTLRGTDEPRLKNVIEEHESDLVSASMFLRIMELSGQALQSPDDLLNLSSGDLSFLRGRFDEVEYGPDTDIEVVCEDQLTAGPDGKPRLVSKGCGCRFWMKLPVGKRSFFFRSGSSRSSRVICSRSTTGAASISHARPAVTGAASSGG